MNPLAKDIYQILRVRVPRAHGQPATASRLSYSDLCNSLAARKSQYHQLGPDSAILHDALGQVVDACRAAGLPAFPAIVVRFDLTARTLTIPGPGYYERAHPGVGSDYVDRMQAWAQEVQQVERTNYPARLP